MDDTDYLLFEASSHHHYDDSASEVLEDDMLLPPDNDDFTLWDEDEYDELLDTFDDDQSVSYQVSGFVQHHQANLDCTSSPMRDRHWVIARIEAMLERIVDGLLEKAEALVITLKSRSSVSRKRSMTKPNARQVSEPKERNISFPGTSAQEAWTFTVLLRILELVHGGLVDNTIMTKRDIYYRHPDLFVKQSVVDRYVDDIACTLEVTRAQLNVTAAAKGLVAGNFTITRQDGYQIDCMQEADGILVPNIHANDEIGLMLVHWVVIVEKEATFRSILSSPQWHDLGRRGILLTAKGYPDLASRKFLRQISQQIPKVPLYALVDLDPDGLAILSTYKYGSRRLAHENVVQSGSHGLSLANIRWLGVQGHQISQIPRSEDCSKSEPAPELQGLMKLTARDRAKAAQMLDWDVCAEDGCEPAWRQELQRMLLLNLKAEMQILDELSGGLVAWLAYELGDTKEYGSLTQLSNTVLDDGMLL